MTQRGVPNDEFPLSHTNCLQCVKFSAEKFVENEEWKEEIKEGEKKKEERKEGTGRNEKRDGREEEMTKEEEFKDRKELAK